MVSELGLGDLTIELLPGSQLAFDHLESVDEVLSLFFAVEALCAVLLEVELHFKTFKYTILYVERRRSKSPRGNSLGGDSDVQREEQFWMSFLIIYKGAYGALTSSWQ